MTSCHLPLLRRALALAALAMLPIGAAAQVFTEFTVPGGGPRSITQGPDGAMWFTEQAANKIGRITTAGAVTEFTIPTANSGPDGIVTGPDGNLWFVESTANKVGRVTTLGAFTEFTIPTAGSNPNGIAAGPDGNLWFCETNGNKIGRITPAGVITEFTLPTPGSLPRRITAGPDKAMWFTQASDRIGRIATGVPNLIIEFPLPTTGGSPFGIVAGPDGAIWFTEANGPRVGRFFAGTITEFIVSGQPEGLAFGPDGALYFGTGGGQKVGRMTTAGVYTNYQLPTFNSAPFDVVAGTDGSMWFTAITSAKVVRGLFDPGRVTNISTRGEVLTGNDVMIAGFIISGNMEKTVVVNVAGPSLVPYGIPNALANPTLTIVRSSDQSVIASNDNWQTQANPADVAAIQATGYQPNNTVEPAVILSLPPGAYTAIVQGVGSTGVGLVGVFVVP